MDSERVRQVMEDSIIYEVRFKGAPVWIEELNGVKARVRALESGRHFDVMVHELVEGEGFPGE
ncbi:MAG: small, acid-soluble spore protein, H family [Syntrophomonadaceae bacterium]|nr:small, acid-soluble spore protein, H family [Syntrophomonadaceae bacterium]